MPNRVIKDSIKRSEQIDSLTWFEEVVFYRLMVTADDYGCIDGRTVLLKNELFPLKENVTRKSVDDAISRLVSVGLLVKYTVSGMPYLFFPTWEKHQRIRNKRRKFPQPPAPSDNLLSNDGQMTASCPPESESESKIEPYGSSAEQPDDGRSAASEYALMLNTGETYNVPLEDVALYRRLYPAVDVDQELRAMMGWCLANPRRRKTDRGIKAFITGWLKRAQDGHQPKREPEPPAEAYNPYTDPDFWRLHKDD